MDRRIPNLLTEDENGIKIAELVAKCSVNAVIEKALFLANVWTFELLHLVWTS